MLTWEEVGVWRRLHLWGVQVGTCSKEWVSCPGFKCTRAAKTVEENQAFVIRLMKTALWDALNEIGTPPENNHQFATRLRRIVFEALKLVLIDGVPNSIPSIGFEVVLQIEPGLRKCIKRGGTKGWTRMSDLDGKEVWSVPAWELLRFADEVDRLAASEAKGGEE